MQVRQTLRRLAVAIGLTASLVLGGGLAASAGVGPLGSSAAHGTAQRRNPEIAGIYMNYDSISEEGTTSRFGSWIDALCF